MAYWLIKSEPTVYAWATFRADGRTRWDGVRNFEARNNLRAMKAGDLCLFYHSNVGKDAVGVARVIREAYDDPSAPGEDWSAIDVEPAYALEKPVDLATMKEREELAELELITRSRLSVTKVTPAQWKVIHSLARTPVRDGAKPKPKTKKAKK